MRLVLLGLPGAGKGTQGELISKKYHIPHISTGSMIRGAIASGSELGREADRYISKGNLIPDEVAIGIVQERLQKPDCEKGWILDGFPRTVRQATFLDERLQQSGERVEIALDIRITPEEAIRRIAQRRVCRSCGAVYHLEYYRAKGKGICDKCGGDLYQRDDDTEETARNRLEVYMDQTHPVIHYYAQTGRLFSVDGERMIEAVFTDVDPFISPFTLQEESKRVGDLG